MATVIALAHGPLSDHEALVMYATAVHGTPRCDLPAITGLSEPDVQQALAQLVRRGLIRTTHRTTSTHRKESTVLETDHPTPRATPTPTRLDASTSRADALDRLTPSHAEPGTDTLGALALRELPEAVVRVSRLAERGAGVSQILEQAPVPGATPQHRLMVALMLRGMLWGALRTGRAPAGIKNTRRDLERTLRYIDKRITPLAEAAPGGAGNIDLPPIQPMAIDDYGAEIDVREGSRSLRVFGCDQPEAQKVAALIEDYLGDGVPPMSITVNLPVSWLTGLGSVRVLCDAIRATYLANWRPGCEMLA